MKSNRHGQSRVLDTQEQRETLKTKWRVMRADNAPKHQSIPGSTIKTVSPTQVEERLKTSQLIIGDILGSRDSISLATIFELERLFDLELVSREDWLKAAESYFDYVSGGGNE